MLRALQEPGFGERLGGGFVYRHGLGHVGRTSGSPRFSVECSTHA